MKVKILLFSILVSLAMTIQAQVIDRHGDRYTVDGMRYSTSTALRNHYLKANNPELYADFNKGYKVAASGWGLFCIGTVVTPFSTLMMFVPQEMTRTDPMTGELVVIQGHPGWFEGWLACTILASASFCASIPMLGVGYHRMHQSIDTYNTQQQSQTYWSVQIQPNSIGFAYHF